MSPPTQSGGPGHHPEAAATRKTDAAAKLDDRGQGTWTGGMVVDLGERRSQRLALDHLDAAGLCVCWIASRPCPMRTAS